MYKARMRKKRPEMERRKRRERRCGEEEEEKRRDVKKLKIDHEAKEELEEN